ncbi:hypothetical protein HGB07_06405 [Candidatus Roizmanbacteria bacterium]|nr:hypothetical protein [Candidatus Roizmanbacteria bacterium]
MGKGVKNIKSLGGKTTKVAPLRAIEKKYGKDTGTTSQQEADKFMEKNIYPSLRDLMKNGYNA